MPRWTLALAFAAGLALGALLFRRPALAPVAPAAAPATVVTPAPVSEAAPAPAAPAKPNGEKKPAERIATDPRLAAELAERQRQLAETEREVAEAQAKINTLEGRITALTSQNATAVQQEKELEKRIETLQREVTSAESAAKSRDTRIAELEQAQARAVKTASVAQQQMQQRLAGTAAELEELARRREAYVNNILGRYREATDLFRAMSLRLDNPRDAGTPLNNDLSRIQTAIQHADEDLRQLRALNAQSAKLQKELSARR